MGCVFSRPSAEPQGPRVRPEAPTADAGVTARAVVVAGAPKAGGHPASSLAAWACREHLALLLGHEIFLSYRVWCDGETWCAPLWMFRGLLSSWHRHFRLLFSVCLPRNAPPPFTCEIRRPDHPTTSPAPLLCR